MEYEKWLKSMRKQCSVWEHYLVKEVLSIPSEEITHCRTKRYKISDQEDGFAWTPSFWVPDSAFTTGWVYIFDLDNELFICNNAVWRGPPHAREYCVQRYVAWT